MQKGEWRGTWFERRMPRHRSGWLNFVQLFASRRTFDERREWSEVVLCHQRVAKNCLICTRKTKSLPFFQNKCCASLHCLVAFKNKSQNSIWQKAKTQETGFDWQIQLDQLNPGVKWSRSTWVSKPFSTFQPRSEDKIYAAYFLHSIGNRNFITHACWFEQHCCAHPIFSFQFLKLIIDSRLGWVIWN